MKVIDIRTGAERAPEPDDEETSGSRSVKIILTETERQTLLKACERYRHSIPTYIQSKQAELHVVDAIIEKLSKPGLR
jgi:hypothetical protein